ncbi:phosphopantetheine-binding protein [Paenibacillus sp. GCM10027627]|uniref:phosphopantetheine-binding protein n=1 Tax=unclassified Paenibacillus TaxID=185978 RepID=UPI00363C6067
METKVLECVGKYAALPQLNVEELEQLDLQNYGLDSLKIINLILDLEDAFDIQFPDQYLSYENISTISKIRTIVSELTGA